MFRKHKNDVTDQKFQWILSDMIVEDDLWNIVTAGDMCEVKKSEEYEENRGSS